MTCFQMECQMRDKVTGECKGSDGGAFCAGLMDEEHYKAELKKEIIKHPSHYTYGKIECIDYIRDKNFDFCLGNAIKYITRAGHKGDAVEDLEKAKQYIDFEIEMLSKK